VQLTLNGSRHAYMSFGASAGPADVPAGIDKVIYAAQQAPSSFGTQPYKVRRSSRSRSMCSCFAR
jgi:hypothetical protein